MNEEIYFAGSIRGGREDVELYLQLIEHLRQYGNVLTEHVGDRTLALKGEDGLTNPAIHNRDMGWLGRSKRIVAEVTTASLGVGYEIGRIVERNEWVKPEERKDILCLYRPSADRRLSAMIAGSIGVTNAEYQTIEGAKRIIDGWILNDI